MSRTGKLSSLALLVLLTGARAPAEEAATPTQLRISSEVGAAREMSLEVGQNRLLILSEEIQRVAVADPSVADLRVVTPRQVLLTAKGTGSTDLTLWNRANEPLVIALRVTRNLEDIRRQLKQLFPKETVQVSAAGDLVVLSDVRVPERVADVVKLHAPKVANLLQVSGNQQVQLEVRFAEVSRSALREIGLNVFYKTTDRVGGLFNSRTIPGDFLNTTTNPAIPGTGPRGLAGPGQPPDVPFPGFQNSFSFFFSQFGSLPFSAMLNLLESQGLAKVLAEPTLVTMTGQEAKFLAGGEMPIPLASSLGSVTVEWKKFGIILEFTPTVIDEKTINLKVKTEVSDIDPTTSVTVGSNTIPGLVSRQSETTVRLGDGQSFAVAGLLSDKVRSQIDKVPFLGSLPILGALFRSTAFRREETELLVVVTGRLAKPLPPHEVPPLPTDYEVNDPGNLGLFLLGSEGGPGKEREPVARASREQRGPVGERGFAR